MNEEAKAALSRLCQHDLRRRSVSYIEGHAAKDDALTVIRELERTTRLERLERVVREIAHNPKSDTRTALLDALDVFDATEKEESK